MVIAAQQRTFSRLAGGAPPLMTGGCVGMCAPAFRQALSAPGQAQSSNAGQHEDRSCAGRAEPASVAPFLRTELFFGSNKPDGSVVSEAEFQRFLDLEITPRFPDGLTLLTGLGQFRGSSGRVERERSMLL